MKRARIIVLAIALVAALGAAGIAKRVVSTPREVQQVEKTVGAVDVLVAARDINLGDSVGASQTLEQKGDEKVATGKTATLELTPRQTETLALAQSMGEISSSPATRRRARASAVT
jgi:pilus assembly protein CpaB